MTKKNLIVLLLIVLGAAALWYTKSKNTTTAENNNQKVEVPRDDVNTVYSKNCVQCHRADMGGELGPNLTDDFWISGSTMAAVEKSIEVGNPDRGMPAYGSLLGPDQIKELAVLIKNAQGTNPPNPKAPQGFGEKLKD